MMFHKLALEELATLVHALIHSQTRQQELRVELDCAMEMETVFHVK
jgi:hypothetical protein